MAWNFFVMLAVSLTLSVVSFLLQRKPSQMSPAARDDLAFPRPREGEEIPVLFGTKHLKGACSAWWGDVRTSAITVKSGRRYGVAGPRSTQTVGHRYFAGAHLVLCHAPLDVITRITSDDELAWSGIITPDFNDLSAYRRITINAPELHGGEQREGGVSGQVDIGFGYRQQRRNDYLARVISSDVPAYRGVVSVILRQVYLGTTGYPKPWGVWATRIRRDENGDPQWLDQYAPIGIFAARSLALYIAIDNSGSMASGAGSRMENAKASIIGVLELFDNFDQGIPVDIMVVAWNASSTSIMRRNITPTSLQEIKTWVGGIRAGGGTNFEAAVNAAPSFFGGAGTKPRFVMFITDGMPNPLSSVAPAAATLFSISGVQSYGFNIELQNTTYTAQMDNTPQDGVPVVTGGDPGPLRDAISLALSVHIDMNPIHIIRECMRNETWGRGLPETEFGATWEPAAQQVFAERLGMSLLWWREAGVSEFIEEVIRHIDAIRYEDPETGLQEIKLIRGDYDVEALPVLDASNSDVVERNTLQPGELVNQVTVEYWDYRRDDISSITVQDTAAITMTGRIVNQTQQYHGFSNADAAMQAALRDLAQLSRPLDRVVVSTTRAAANLKPGDVFRLDDPDEGKSQVMRVAKRREGGLLNGMITLECAEDVFAVEYATYTAPDESGWVDPIGDPRNHAAATATEVPYLMALRDGGEAAVGDLPAGAGFYAYAGARPAQGSHIDYRLYVGEQGEAPEDQERREFTPIAIVSAAVGNLAATSLPIEGLRDADVIEAGDLALIGEGPDSEREWVVIDQAPEAGAETLSVIRGVADTVPRPIAQGAIIYAVESAAGLAADTYQDGQTVIGYGAPANSRGEYMGDFLERPVQMASRIDRPYPPANLRLDGHYDGAYPGQFTSPGTLTWAHRSRLAQGDQPVGWFDAADHGPEPGTTYRIEVYGVDGAGNVAASPFVDEGLGLVASYELDIANDPPPSTAASIQFRLWSVRDGYDSLQHATLTVPILLPPVIIDVEGIALLAPEIIDVEGIEDEE